MLEMPRGAENGQPHPPMLRSSMGCDSGDMQVIRDLEENCFCFCFEEARKRRQRVNSFKEFC